MTLAEAEDLITRSRKALKSHSAELRRSQEPGDLQAAISTILGVLESVAKEHPGKWAEINALVAHYGPYVYARRRQDLVEPNFDVET